MNHAHIFPIFLITTILSLNGQETNQKANLQHSPTWNEPRRPNTWSSNQFPYEKFGHKCPKHWIRFEESCYRFIRSPLRRRDDARLHCQAYQSDLMFVNSITEHGFMLHQLQRQDPQHRAWYTIHGANEISSSSSSTDSSHLGTMQNALLPEPKNNLNGDALAYNYSYSLQRWGLQKVDSYEPLRYICEAPISILENPVEDDRDYSYGNTIGNLKEIPRGPYFIQQPVDQVFDPAKGKQTNSVVLRCVAGGYPHPDYEWFKEDSDNGTLSAQLLNPLVNTRYTFSGGNLIIENPNQKQDSGTYHCRASNKFGVIMSDTARVSFAFMNEFNLDRAQESGDQNWGKVVYCDPPAHNPSAKYYWSRDYFPNFVDQDKRVFVSDDGALYFAALEPIDGGNYSCNLQGISLGRNGPFFPVRVNLHSSYQQLKFPLNFPKVFPTAPIAGEEVRMECIAFGYPVASYNWTRKGTPLPRNAKLNNYNRVLLIPRVRVEDQGEYICTAFNQGTSIKNSVLLTVQAKPNFTVPLEDKHVDLRSDVTWSCEAFGNPDAIYDWFKNGLLLDNLTLQGDQRDRYHIQDNVLKIDRVEEKDAGMYQCRAKNVLKATYSSAQLRVLSIRPTFRKHPMASEIYAAAQGNVTIVCNPEAAPRPKFIWKKNNLVIDNGPNRRILPNGNLIISPVSADDVGVYTCKAINMWGTDETSGRLSVLRGPTFRRGLPETDLAITGRNHTLVCEAETDENLELAYIWKHHAIEIRDQPSHQRFYIDDGTLTITNVTLADAGDYECTVRSAVGEIANRTILTVEGPPGPPGSVTVVSIEKMSAVLEWTDGASNGKPISHYTVAVRSTWTKQWLDIASNISAEQTKTYQNRKRIELIRVLNSYLTYQFAVSAANEYGYGPFSTPSPQFNTSPDEPTRAPSNVGGGGGTFGFLVITWKPLSPADHNGPDIYYKVFYRLEGETEFESVNLQGKTNVSSVAVPIPEKYYYTKYQVMVQAANKFGDGPKSKLATIFSAGDLPQVQPTNIQSFKYNSTSLNVSWTPINESREIVRGKLIGYRLKYWPASVREEQCTYYLSRTKRPWSLIVGLEPDTEYYVKVMVYNSNGAGPESERMLEKTYRKAPQNPPSTVEVFKVNPSTIRITWRYVQPSLDEEPLDGYKIRIWGVDEDISMATDTIVPLGRKLEKYITDLSPGKPYQLRALAYSQGGDGRMSSPSKQFQLGFQLRNAASNEVLDSSVGICLLISMWRLGLV